MHTHPAPHMTALHVVMHHSTFAAPHTITPVSYTHLTLPTSDLV